MFVGFFRGGVQVSGGRCFESVPGISMNKVLFWLPPFAPPGLTDSPPRPRNICIFYISEQGEWQPATRVRQLPDFTVQAVQEQTGELKHWPESGQHYTGFTL